MPAFPEIRNGEIQSYAGPGYRKWYSKTLTIVIAAGENLRRSQIKIKMYEI
jgi:hypothetical protein